MKTRAGVSWSFEKKRGLGKNHLVKGKIDGKEKEEDREGGGKSIRDVFDMSLTETGSFRCAVRDVTSYGISS